MEKLGQLKAEGRWDLIVVDTPPSRSALDFLDAPQRLGRFLDGRMIRMLTGAGAGRRPGVPEGVHGGREDVHRRTRPRSSAPRR